MCSIVYDFSGDNRPHAIVKINTTSLKGLLDSGANCTILGKGCETLLDDCNLVTTPYITNLKTADGTTHKSTQVVDLPITFNGKTKTLQTLLVPTLSKTLILGMDFWFLFNIKPVCSQVDEVLEQKDTIDLSTNEQLRLTEAVESLKSAIPGEPISRTHLIEHKIDTGDTTPIKQRYYPVSPYVQKEMDEELERLLSLGVIEKSNSSWSNPIVGVRKPTGKLRLCLDSRKLNNCSKTDAFPLPYISRILGRLRGTKYLSSIDLSDAFWQIPVAKNDREKTAFTVPNRGLFHFVSLPFGLHGAAQSLCRLMDAVLGYDLEPSVFVYLDDIIIATDTFDDHIRLIQEVGRRLKAANLSVSKTKSKFCMRKLNYLGYIIDQSGINVNPEKVAAIVNYPSPKSVRDVRRLLGMATWYNRFISNFASLTAPITNLLKKTQIKFVWTDEAEAALNSLKTALISAPVLSTPDFTKPFIIQTDASDKGVGAVLVQEEKENEKVICYMSQKLSVAQTKYTTTEKECLAVILAIEKFRPYIEGVKFTVITDHASLLWLTNLKDPTGRLARWALRLQQHDYTLIHRKGKFMVVPDSLSRVFSLETDNDVWYNSLHEKIKHFPDHFSNFLIIDNLIYKNVRELNSSNFSWKLVVPQSMRNDILKQYHDEPISSHGGVRKTLSKIKTRYYWPGMAKEIKKYVKVCEICQTCKPVNYVLRGEMGQPKDPQAPWKMISVDLVGPLPRSKGGFSFILVVLDVYSKFVLLHPLKRATAETVIKFLEQNVFLMFSVPSVVICDNGSQFIAKKFKDFLKDYNTRLWYTASYLPQANPVERVNRSIKCALRGYVKDNHSTWCKFLPHVGCALRTAIHGATQFTPYYLNFGQEMATSGQDHLVDSTLETLNLRSSDRITTLNKLRGKVKANLVKAYQEYSSRYNLRSRKITFEVGDLVLKRNFVLSDASKGISASLNPSYVKCFVKKKHGSNCYQLSSMEGKDLGVFSLKDLKIFDS